MKNPCDILLSITFELLRRRKVTASYLCEKYSVSPRSVYRYIARLSTFLPLHVRRGRNGGIYLADNYLLPADFLTVEEYDAVLSALSLAYAKFPLPPILSAKKKITAGEKGALPAPVFCGDCGDFLLLSSEKEEETTRLLPSAQRGLKEKKILRFLTNAGEDFPIEPHLLILCKGEWLLYAFCRERRDFFLFPLAECKGIFRTDESFRPRPFDREKILQRLK